MALHDDITVNITGRDAHSVLTEVRQQLQARSESDRAAFELELANCRGYNEELECMGRYVTIARA